MTKTAFRALLAASMLALMGGMTRQATAGPVVNATISQNGNTFSTQGLLDLTTGQFTASANLSVTVTSMTSGANGTLYAAALDTNLYTLGAGGVVTRFGTGTAPINGPGIPGFLGLAAAGPSGFYGFNVSGTPEIDKISPSGNSVSPLGSLGNVFFNSSGSLAFGPDGALYLAASSLFNAQLFRIDQTTGLATPVGAGLVTPNNDGLALVTVGGTLYGIDAVQPSGSGPIGIFTVDTTTGRATATGVDVTGLPDGFTLDTAAAVLAAVPEPSSLSMVFAGSLTTLVMTWVRRRRNGA